ncbi:MAG: formate dehydrogenase accessory protein FdhE [candidate division WOR-3 bacterium]
MKINLSIDEAINLLRKRTSGMEFLQKLLPVYESLMYLNKKIKAHNLEINLSQSDMIAQLQNGIPILCNQNIKIDIEPMKVVYKDVHKISSNYFVRLTDKFVALGDLPDKNHSLWSSIMQEYFRNNKISGETKEEKDCLNFLLVHTWRPFLRHWALDFRDWLKDIQWFKPFCPICGGRPDFSYLEKPTGALHLLCSRCDTDWMYHRGECIFCGNEDNKTYLYYPDEKGLYRLYVCKKCLHYLKTIDCRELTEEPILAVERITTTPMDISAIKEGYINKF